MIQKLIAWIFLVTFAAIIVAVGFAIYFTYGQGDYGFTIAFSLLIPICIAMMLIIYDYEFS